MIPLDPKKLIALQSVPDRLPCHKNGRKVHISAVYRWAHKGVRGVRLSTMLIAGTLYTTMEELENFFNATKIESSKVDADDWQINARRALAANLAALELGLDSAIEHPNRKPPGQPKPSDRARGAAMADGPDEPNPRYALNAGTAPDAPAATSAPEAPDLPDAPGAMDAPHTQSAPDLWAGRIVPDAANIQGSAEGPADGGEAA